MSIKHKLARLKGHMVRNEPTHQDETEVSFPEKKGDDTIPYLERWRDFGAKPFFFDDEYCLIREVVYPLDYQHGIYRLGQLHEIHAQWKHASFAHPLSSQGHEVSDLFFFDTETTGLGSGAGHVIFLLGHARVFSDRVVVRQHFLPNPGAEVALYQSFLSEVDYTTLVTYNGKAFDWPKVKTRHTLIRETVPKLPAFGHFDLYHAARRIWKHRLESVRLANVEKEILGVKRENDIPGFLAPMIYFDFLTTHDPEGIFGVLRHNEYDVLSLIVLYIHLSKQILEAGQIEHTAEQFAMARWFDGLGQMNAARQTYEFVAENNGSEAVQAKWNLSIIYKKEKNYEEAIRIWQELLQSHSVVWKMKAAIELAKAYEHHVKQWESAYHYACLAYDIWKSRARMNKQTNEMEKHEFLKRIERLERKLRK